MDLFVNESIPEEEASKYAKSQGVEFSLVSAKEGTNIEEFFLKLLNKLDKTDRTNNIEEEENEEQNNNNSFQLDPHKKEKKKKKRCCK